MRSPNRPRAVYNAYFGGQIGKMMEALERWLLGSKWALPGGMLFWSRVMCTELLASSN